MKPAVKKAKPITFRIENKILETIRKEGEREQLTTSNLINKILKRYVEWDVYEPKVGMMPIPKVLLEKLFEGRTKEEVVELATKVGRYELEDASLFMNKKSNWESFLRWFEKRMQNTSIEINDRKDNKKHTFIIKHNIGENWSLYHKTIFELLAKENYKKPVEIRYNNRIISIEFCE